MKLIKLKPKESGLFHIGEKGLQSTEIIIHSDTLFSAICNNYRLIYGKDGLERFLGQSEKLRLSSAFHYLDICKEGELQGTVLFLPKPFIRFKFDERGELLKEDEPKTFKKIEFISLNVLKRWNKDQIISFDKKYIIDDKYLIDKEDYSYLGLNSSNEEEIEKIINKIRVIKESEEQKVVIDRINNTSDTFYQSNFELLESNYFIWENNTKIRYTTKAGFYFLINDDEINKNLFASIRIIKDQGIGGERSSGKGIFEAVEIVDSKEFNELIESKQGTFISMSLVFPEKDEISKLKYYSLIERKGFIYSDDGKSLRRRSIRMLKEGSIINEEIHGKMVDVAPATFNEHKVYRNGLAFLVPIKGEVE